MFVTQVLIAHAGSVLPDVKVFGGRNLLLPKALAGQPRSTAHSKEQAGFRAQQSHRVFFPHAGEAITSKWLRHRRCQRGAIRRYCRLIVARQPRFLATQVLCQRRQQWRSPWSTPVLAQRRSHSRFHVSRASEG
jgi:hypothetical protein